MKFSWFFGGRRRPSDFMESFAAKRLPQVLATIGRPPVAKIELFPHGRHRSVYRVVLDDGSALVLRIYLSDEPELRAVSHWHLNRLMADLGFCVPTIHFRGVFPFGRRGDDVHVTIEDFVEGKEVEAGLCDQPAIRRQMAEILHLLHNKTAPRPGKPWVGSEKLELVLRMAEKAPVLFRRIRAQLPEVTSQQATQCLKWIRENVARRPVPQEYELIYGGFDARDLLLTPQGRIALIDTGSIAFDVFETDLVDARWGFLDQAWFEDFCADYFALAPFRRERYERDAPIYFARFYLNTAASRAVRARKNIEKGKHEEAEFFRAESRRFWNWLISVVEGGALS
ncbi:hypothetical protein FJY63_05070 [Candidatus Sumerlaeota bacterium]|nr:hypothetical protein [Candidatus Sumerlaeota bacterium]